MIPTIKLMAIALLFSGISSCKKDVAPNVAPTVSITSPADNSSFATPASITITATATDADGSISKVEFYNGATLIGTSTTSPYSFTWTGAAAGPYSITAKATDNSGAVTTSAAINTTVNVGFSATLNGANERPTPVTSTATGTSVASFNITTKIISIVTTYTGITPTAGHIHTGAATVAGPVTFGFTSLTSPITFTTPALAATQEADLMANQMYVNLHTAAFPGGEIRGQLIKQ